MPGAAGGGHVVAMSGNCSDTNITCVVFLGHETYCPVSASPASRWNLTGDYGDTDAFQFLPLTADARSISGSHIRYAPEFGEILGS